MAQRYKTSKQGKTHKSKQKKTHKSKQKTHKSKNKHKIEKINIKSKK